jgi:hypothetical protein
MPINVSETLADGACYGCLPAPTRWALFATILCRINQTFDPLLGCSTEVSAAYGGLPPSQVAFLQAQLACEIAQLSDPTYDCSASAIAESEPQFVNATPDDQLTVLVVLAAQLLVAAEPTADVSPDALMESVPCFFCAGLPLDAIIAQQLCLWLTNLNPAAECDDPTDLVEQCSCSILNLSSGPLTALGSAFFIIDAAPPEENFIAMAGQLTDQWLRAGGVDSVLLSGL